MSGQTISGQVAMIEDDYTLVVNRGGDAGVAPGMVFAVYSSAGPVITDPESGRELGRLAPEKLRVRVFNVQPLFSRAHTFVDTGDFYGLLKLPFTAPRHEDVVSIDVGDAVELVGAVGDAQRAGRTG